MKELTLKIIEAAKYGIQLVEFHKKGDEWEAADKTLSATSDTPENAVVKLIELAKERLSKGD